jgi:hypothetical protein
LENQKYSPYNLVATGNFGRLWCDSEKTLIVKDSQLAERKKA